MKIIDLTRLKADDPLIDKVMDWNKNAETRRRAEERQAQMAKELWAEEKGPAKVEGGA